MREKQIQQIFKEINKIYGVFELKLCKDKSISFKAVKDWQIEGLLNINSEQGLYHKISDSPWTQRYTLKKPFDCFYLKFIPSYIVLCWYVPRKEKEFHYIPIIKFIEEKKKSKRKSLTKERSKEIANYIIDS